MSACSTSGCPCSTGWPRPGSSPAPTCRSRCGWSSPRRSTPTSTSRSRCATAPSASSSRTAARTCSSRRCAPPPPATPSSRHRSRCATSTASSGRRRRRRQRDHPLSERELDVARAVARGLGNQEIAAELFISLSTVKTHLTSIQTKLRLRNRVQIAIWVTEHDPRRRLGRSGADRRNRPDGRPTMTARPMSAGPRCRIVTDMTQRPSAARDTIDRRAAPSAGRDGRVTAAAACRGPGDATDDTVGTSRTTIVDARHRRPPVDASAYAVFDAQASTMLATANADARLSVGSLMKLLNAVVAYDAGDPDHGDRRPRRARRRRRRVGDRDRRRTGRVALVADPSHVEGERQRRRPPARHRHRRLRGCLRDDDERRRGVARAHEHPCRERQRARCRRPVLVGPRPDHARHRPVGERRLPPDRHRARPPGSTGRRSPTPTTSSRRTRAPTASRPGTRATPATASSRRRPATAGASSSPSWVRRPTTPATRPRPRCSTGRSPRARRRDDGLASRSAPPRRCGPRARPRRGRRPAPPRPTGARSAMFTSVAPASTNATIWSTAPSGVPSSVPPEMRPNASPHCSRSASSARRAPASSADRLNDRFTARRIPAGSRSTRSQAASSSRPSSAKRSGTRTPRSSRRRAWRRAAASLRAGATDPDRQAGLHRRGQARRVGDREVLAGERRALLGEQAPDDRRRLVQHRGPRGQRRERVAERAALRLVPAGTEPDLEPPAGEVVDRRRRLRQHTRACGSRRRTRDSRGGSATSRPPSRRAATPARSGPASRPPAAPRRGGPSTTASRGTRRTGARAAQPVDPEVLLAEVDAEAQVRWGSHETILAAPAGADERRGRRVGDRRLGRAQVGASTTSPRSPVFRILTALRRGVRPRTRAIVSVFQARPANAAHGHRGSRWSRSSGNGVRPLVAGCCHRFRHDRACGEANGLARPSHASVSPQT